jgi:hypothetical protein
MGINHFSPDLYFSGSLPANMDAHLWGKHTADSRAKQSS